MKGGMAVVGERDRATDERVMGRVLGVAVGRSLSEDFTMYIGSWLKICGVIEEGKSLKSMGSACNGIRYLVVNRHLVIDAAKNKFIARVP